MDDEKKIREKETEAKRVQKAIRNLEERIRGFDYDKLIDEKTELLQKSSRIDNQVRSTPSILLFAFPCHIY